ncbi:GTP 3',8-cyclase MoaA [Castellaniella sp.]|uniref:GTP 3',8-cyclase MoaA n=1 Tax=Castellaniella sp. TaxID=1955812 RepID=UPI002AFF17BA|nr:GTP 3',8-cyclase MoaA [Castellaniella sp.]
MSRVIFHRLEDQHRPAPDLAPGDAVRDTFGRPLRDLRISVTDRCNFRCTYCMPREVFGSDHVFLPHSALLTFEEITRVAAVAVSQGVHKIRLTGGEPLLRKQIEVLVGMLAQLRTPDGQAPELTLTTNGTLLAKKADALARAGLSRVTVSLDALDDALFERMSDSGVAVATVLAGIDAAAAAGLAPVKVNMVVRRGMNDAQILPMARHFRGTGHVLRFIEYMDVGNTNGWRMDEVVTGADIVRLIASEFPLQPAQPQYRGEVASRWAYADGAGEIGLITSVSQPFCGDCTRLRLSPEGRLFTCLFAEQGHDLRALLRSGADDQALRDRLAGVWLARDDRYSERRGQAHRDHKIEMSYIGG